MRIVIVEDDVTFAGQVAALLADREGWQTEVVGTAREAMRRFALPDFDAVILDLGLPDMDGGELLTRARSAGLRAPVLVLSAHGELADRLRLLGLGADDHLGKPCAADELLARLRVIVRRASGPRWAPLSCGQVALCTDVPEVQVAGHAVPLSPRERALLELFLRRQGEILSHAVIRHEVFDSDFDPGTNIVVVHVSHLRRKLQGGGAVIETVRGMGYRMRPARLEEGRDETCSTSS